jgi:hypothetical protein
MRKIHNTETKVKSSCASATPSAAISNSRPQIMETIEQLL